jgi:hypothetical protein
MKKQILLLSFLLFALACEKTQENKLSINENEVNFCSFVDSPEKYKAKVIQTKGIVLGYHTFIFYSRQCLEQDKVLALEMDYESRHKIGEALYANKINYKTSFLNNNLYAEITVLGELKENDEKETDVFHPKYKFFVNEIKNVNILLEEIYPSEEARGVRTVKQ